MIGFLLGERTKGKRLVILRNYKHTQLTLYIKNVFCAHRKLTGRLERAAQRGARGRLRQRGHVLECVLFVLFLSLFLKARLL